jgi:branched-chain amino acid transport system substrate-binding protein
MGDRTPIVSAMRTVTVPPRRHRAIALALCAGLIVSACTGGDDETAPTTAAITTTTVVERVEDGQLVLGVFLPRTGPGASLGEPMIAAVQEAVDSINVAGGVLGQDVRIEAADENGGGGMAQLVQLGVDAIVGPASSTVALEQLDDVVQPGTGVVTCSPSATTLALDDYPDNKLFFRTVPSDSLQMAAIAKRVASTGVESVSVAYLDDRYGRGLNDAFTAQAADRAFAIEASVPFSADQEDLSEPADDVLATDPRIVVVLGGPDDTTRLLAAMDTATVGSSPPTVIVNEAVRAGRQAIPALSERFRNAVIGVAPLAKPAVGDAAGFFTANAVDCVNLIALAAVQAGSDAPERIQTTMAAVSREGIVCTSFADCVEQLEAGLQIDYNGLSGSADLSTTTGDLARAFFEVFVFDAQGVDVVPDDALFAVP